MTITNTKKELINICKKLGYKNLSNKTKNELQLLIDNTKYETITPNIINKSDIFNDVLAELVKSTVKDKTRKVCKGCGELGHDKNSKICKINIENNNKLRQKVKNYILRLDCLNTNTNIDQICQELSIILGITSNHCKNLYDEIPVIELLDRPLNIEKYISNILENKIKCFDCDKSIIQSNTNRIWKGNTICDTCYSNYNNEREQMWKMVKHYKPIICAICQTKQTSANERFHYDHINMFNKVDSICSMINLGSSISDIYKEIDKCQILCLSCHHIVTDIENKLGFIRIKSQLTKNLNNGDISEIEYNNKILIYQDLYYKKIENIYSRLKILFLENSIN